MMSRARLVSPGARADLRSWRRWSRRHAVRIFPPQTYGQAAWPSGQGARQATPMIAATGWIQCNTGTGCTGDAAAPGRILNCIDTHRRTRQVLPTPLSPRTTTLASTCSPCQRTIGTSRVNCPRSHMRSMPAFSHHSEFLTRNSPLHPRKPENQYKIKFFCKNEILVGISYLRSIP
jgi:hypothetical protein